MAQLICCPAKGNSAEHSATIGAFDGIPGRLRGSESQRAFRFRPKSRYTALNDTTGHEKRMSSPAASPITGLLLRWSAGEQGCLDELLPLVEGELRRIAHRHMRKEREGHTLQTTALVNEAHEGGDAG
jgi:hypothetical protein